MGLRSVMVVGLGVGVLASTLLGGEGCLACNDSVCTSRLSVSLAEASGALRPGTWVFEFVVDDGQTLRASCTIGPESRTAHCDAGELDVSPVIVDDPGNPYTFFLTGFEDDVGTDGLPSMLDVRVSIDGEQVLERHVEPSYELTEPARCDPDCFSDRLSLKLP